MTLVVAVLVLVSGCGRVERIGKAITEAVDVTNPNVSLTVGFLYDGEGPDSVSIPNTCVLMVKHDGDLVVQLVGAPRSESIGREEFFQALRHGLDEVRKQFDVTEVIIHFPPQPSLGASLQAVVVREVENHLGLKAEVILHADGPRGLMSLAEVGWVDTPASSDAETATVSEAAAAAANADAIAKAGLKKK